MQITLHLPPQPHRYEKTAYLVGPSRYRLPNRLTYVRFIRLSNNRHKRDLLRQDGNHHTRSLGTRIPSINCVRARQARRDNWTMTYSLYSANKVWLLNATVQHGRMCERACPAWVC